MELCFTPGFSEHMTAPVNHVLEGTHVTTGQENTQLLEI